ncbi:MAG: response regulator [Chloroflexota bacterium]|nr:response regulator [Chloroflexota bacterium]
MPQHHSVLIVEDDAAIRDVFGEVLRGAGHDVTLARNGEEAMSLLRDGCAPCLIVADLLMPVLDGWGLAAELARVPQLASIPLVVLSAQLSSGEEGTPPGARARLTKPISIDALIAIVQENCLGADGKQDSSIDGQQVAW